MPPAEHPKSGKMKRGSRNGTFNWEGFAVEGEDSCSSFCCWWFKIKKKHQ